MRRRSPVALPAILTGAAVALAPGCAAERAPATEPRVADSAGVRVITHPAVATTLDVAGEPEVVVGEASGTELFRVRGGVLLDGGRFAVANAGSQQVFLFSGSGELEGVIGQEGQGPREFSNLLWIQAEASGDFVVYDAGNLRFARIDGSGHFVETWPVPFGEPPDVPEGSIVGRGFGIGIAPGDQALVVPWAVALLDGVEGPMPVEGALIAYPREGEGSVVVDSVQLRVWHEGATSEGPPIDQIFRSPVFAYAANRSVIAYTDGASHRVVVLEEGRPGYVVRESREPIPFRPDTLPTGLSRASDVYPAYDDVQVDSDGRVWLRAGGPSDAGVVEWRVLSERGRKLDALALPERSRVLDAAGDRVLLLERDELDVERVTVRRLPGWVS